MNIDSLLIDPRFPLHWQMSRPERVVMTTLLEQLRPSLSLEIGTYKGGSLQVISHYSNRVVSVDLSHEVPFEFPNVVFVAGDSRQVLPGVIQAMNEGETPEFILVDGAHSTDAVRHDINAILSLKPKSDCVILMHDSFNPECREGLLTASWSNSPYIHDVEIDFVQGSYNAAAVDTAKADSMWGGFACAVMRPQKRMAPLVIRQWQKAVFDTMSPKSSAKQVLRRLTPWRA